jgi:hypothetical protein
MKPIEGQTSPAACLARAQAALVRFRFVVVTALMDFKQVSQAFEFLIGRSGRPSS